MEAGGIHRLRSLILYNIRSQEGLGVQDVSKYYLAAHLCPVSSWVQFQSFKLCVAPTHPNAWLWSSRLVPQRASKLAPLYFTYTIWRRASREYALSAPKPLLTSFLYTPAAPDSLSIHMVAPWRAQYLMRFDQLVHPLSRKLRTFSDLRDRYSLPKTSFYRFLHLETTTTTIIGDLTFDRPTEFKRLCKRGSSGRE